MTRPLAVLFALLVTLPAVAADKLPPDLALVPGNAVAFAHVNLADVWQAEVFKEARGLFDKVGQKALTALDAQFLPAPSSVERGTVVAVFGDKPKDPLVVAVILRVSKPFDAEAVRKANLPAAVEKKAGGRMYYADDQLGLAVHFADDQTLAVSDVKGMPTFLVAAGESNGPMQDAVELARKGQAVASVAYLWPLLFSPDVSVPLTKDQLALLKAETVTLTATFAADISVTLSATFPTADDAKAAEKALRTQAGEWREAFQPVKAETERAVFGADGKGTKVRPLTELADAASGVAALAWANWVDETLADPPLKVADKTLSAKLTAPSWVGSHLGVAGAVVLPAIRHVQEAAARVAARNNLKQLMFTMLNSEAAHGTLPAAAICDAKGKKLLSWRVTVLPYLEQGHLYRQFKLDEPWDSEHNKKLIPLMPRVYSDPRTAGKNGETYYKLFVGKNCPFDWDKGRKLDVPDGKATTVMIAAGGDPVTWTKPDDFEFDPLDKNAKLPDLAKPFDRLLVVMFDGSVRTLNLKTLKDPDKQLRAIISPRGGEVVSLDD